MPDIRPWDDYEIAEIRNWLASDIGLAFVEKLKELRAAAVLNLIAASQQIETSVPVQVAGGRIDAFDSLLDILGEETE